MKNVLLATAALIGLTSMSFANSNPALCHHAGLTYSPGAMVTFGKALQKCALTSEGVGIWSSAAADDPDASSANCVSGGREFGHGTILRSGGSDRRCSGGVWTRP